MLKFARPTLVAYPTLLVALAVAAGCAEVITYSNKSVAEGEKLQAQGRIEEAAGAYRNATQQNPRNYRAFFHLGECYQQLGREQQAIQSFRTALDVAPPVNLAGREPETIADVDFRDTMVAAYARCVGTSAAKDAELAALADRAAASKKPIDLYVLARANAEAGDADAAIDAYDRAVAASNSQDRTILKSYGLYLARIGQKPRAEAVLGKAYALRPEDAEVNNALRQLGVVPGPSLMAPDQLHKPVMPKGPLPELEINIRDQKKATPAQ